MNNIVSLPQAVANRIAAGEVVERPSAVVKELIENSLDSGATEITVVIKDAGRTLMKVVDNGTGMSAIDLSLCILRHATSKIECFEDLDRLETFGFRGEALPSVAAVSRLEIISRRHNDDLGNVLRVDGGEAKDLEPISAQPGTSISVSHLFFNVPARRKFLKTDATEFKWISTVFKQFALSFPGVTWKLFKGSKLLYDLPAGDHSQRHTDLFGDDVSEELIEIHHDSDWIKVQGYISPPSLTQSNRDSQYLFLNKRHIIHPGIFHTISSAMEHLIAIGGHPIYIIFLKAEPDRFDINVHPAKRLAKFADENGVRRVLWKAINDGLSVSQRPFEIAGRDKGSDQQSDRNYSVSSKTSNSGSFKSSIGQFSGEVDRRYKAPHGIPMPFPPDLSKDTKEGEVTPSPLNEPHFTELTSPSFEFPDSAGAKNFQEKPEVWQVFDTYIVAPLATGVAFIDQHAAHERILYEKALTAMNKVPWSSQQLLFPQNFSVSPEDVEIVEEMLPLLSSMGFIIEPFGPREFRVEAVPTGIKISSEEDMILHIINQYREEMTTEIDPRKRIAAGFACKAAIKAGDFLETEEMHRLIQDLFQTTDPEFCPHGRPIYHVLGKRDIERWFKR